MKPLQDQIIIVYYYNLFLSNFFKNHLSEKRWKRAAVVKSIATLSSFNFVHSKQNMRWMVRPFIQYCIKLHTDGFFNFKKKVFTAVKRKSSHK